MPHFIFKKILCVVIFLSMVIYEMQAQSVTFNLTTVTYNGTYAPRHCFALWITDASGKYVKTINRQSKNYTTLLTNWDSNSGYKTTDGITGASLTTHNAPLNATGGVSRIPFSWNCKDYNGNLVTDGTYYVNVEFVESNAASKYIKYAFTKGSSNLNISYPNVTTLPGKYFQNAALSYTAPAATGLNDTESNTKYNVSYSNTSKILQISYNTQYHQTVSMDIYNQVGSHIYQKKLSEENTSIGLSKLADGIYFIKLTDKTGKSQTNKVIVK